MNIRIETLRLLKASGLEYEKTSFESLDAIDKCIKGIYAKGFEAGKDNMRNIVTNSIK